MTRAIEPADPATRRRAIAILVVGTVVGAAVLGTIDRWLPSFQRWAASDPARRRTLLLAMAVALTLPCFGFAAYLWRLGTQGEIAGGRGRWLKALALGLAAAVAGLLWTMWRLAALLDQGHA